MERSEKIITYYANGEIIKTEPLTPTYSLPQVKAIAEQQAPPSADRIEIVDKWVYILNLQEEPRIWRKEGVEA